MRISIHVLSLLFVAGCDDGNQSGYVDGGNGGGHSTTGATGANTASSQSTSGSTTSSVHDPCVDIHDCDDTSLLAGTTCEGVACDPSGMKTDPKSAVHGCYLESVDYLTPCAVGGCPGFCEGAGDAGNAKPYVCQPDMGTVCKDGGQ